MNWHVFKKSTSKNSTFLTMKGSSCFRVTFPLTILPPTNRWPQLLLICASIGNSDSSSSFSSTSTLFPGPFTMTSEGFALGVLSGRGQQTPKTWSEGTTNSLELEWKSTKLCKNIPAKFRESPSICSAAHPKIALWQNISAGHSWNLPGIFLHSSVDASRSSLFLLGACRCRRCPSPTAPRGRTWRAWSSGCSHWLLCKSRF